MPQTNLARRNFLRPGLAGAPSEKFQINVKSKLGQARMLFPFEAQELPEVPPPAEKFAFFGGLNPYIGPWTYAQAAHLLRRTGFGLKKSDVDLLLSGTMDAAVEHLLDLPADLPAPPVNNYNNPDFTDPDVPDGEPWLNAPYNGDAEGYRIESWRGWWYDRILDEQASIRERMTLFWHNHFSTQTEIVYWGRTTYNLNQTLRAGALGNFKQLVKAVTIDPMMLIYLNGYLNAKGAPDENYARELQELFTIGKDAPDHYTEADVVAAARVLTGWRVNFDEATSYHEAVEHDFEDKKFSAFYGGTTIAGSVFGEQELDAMLDMIFARPEVSEFVCRKIYRFFVYYDISPATEQAVIKPLAQIFRDNNYDIKPVMEALLKSEHFYEAAQTGCFIKTPVELVLGSIRSFNMLIPGTTPWDKFVFQYILTYFHSACRMMPGDPPNVAGWQAFRQTPQYYRLWINGDSVRNRNGFTDVMSAYYLETDNDQFRFNHILFAAQFSNPEDPVKLVDDTTKLLLPMPLSASKKFLLKNILLSGQSNDSYWTTAWFEFLANPNDPMAVEVVWSRLLQMHLYIMRLPEFQLA